LKVVLIQVDGKLPNLALMKLSKYHKDKGDEVVIIDISSIKADLFYASKVFVGGSGVNLKAKLPEDIEVLVPDYEGFELDHSVGFTSRGCIRNCDFCIVREKEGYIKECNMEWIKHNKVLLWDNNFLASPLWKEKLKYFIDNKIKVSFNQGLDIRLVTDEVAKLLSQVKYYSLRFNSRRLYFAFDNPDLENIIREKVPLLLKYGIKSKHLMFFVLSGKDKNTDFNSTQHRVNVLLELGTLPFIMLYHKKDSTLNRYAKYINKLYYQIMPFDNFLYNFKKKSKR
jgi:hypothetical protein